MSQIDLQKLTKKNQEFVHIATQQFIKDGKTDAEIKAIFEEVIPQILEEQAKGTTARSPLRCTDPLGSQLYCQGAI